MAYFCTQSGARIVAPGIAVSAGGTVPDFDHEDQAHHAAEHAAAVALLGEAKGPGTPPSDDTVKAAVKVATLVVKAGPAAPADPDAPPPAGSLARLWYDRAHAVRDALEQNEKALRAEVVLSDTLRRGLDDVRAEAAQIGKELASARAQLATLQAVPKPAEQGAPEPKADAPPSAEEPAKKPGPAKATPKN